MLGTVFAIEELTKYIPFVGLAFAGSVGFAFTLRYLIKAINEMEGAAIAVWDNAAKRGLNTEHAATQ